MRYLVLVLVFALDADRWWWQWRWQIQVHHWPPSVPYLFLPPSLQPHHARQHLRPVRTDSTSMVTPDRPLDWFAVCVQTAPTQSPGQWHRYWVESSPPVGARFPWDCEIGGAVPARTFGRWFGRALESHCWDCDSVR